ncbi:MAG: zinc ribbon domain-containing protein [Planctomycetes bacterium]|nr:zinc ribbon domain-containing protein [Planctomycetota bacterium]
MALYDFKCRDCGCSFEKLIRKDAEIATLACPTCTSAKVEKQISLPAKPVNSPAGMPVSCGVGPPCGAPHCQRQG